MCNEKKITIFVDAHSFDKEYQGTQTFIEGLYSTLMQQYPELDIYFGAYHTDRIKKAFPFLHPSKILAYKDRKPSSLRLLFDIPKLIRQYSFDLAHFQYVSPIAVAHCQYIVTTHDVLFNDFPKDFSWAYRYKRNYLFKTSIRKAAIKTTVSNYSQQRIAAIYKIDRCQLSILSNAVKSFDDIQLNKEEACRLIKEKYGVENFILNVSRIEPRKNHLLLLNKFIELELYKQNIALVFIGKRSVEVTQLTSIMEGLTKEQKQFIYFIDEVDKEELPLFYQACKLFVYPSKAEGFGIPPLEAAMNMAPVLCSNATAMNDFYFFEPNTFDPENEKEFEKKLAGMISHTPCCTALKMIAEKISERYSWHKSATVFHDLIQTTIQQWD